MLDEKTIVAGVDGSQESVEAAKWAAERAVHSGSKICLVCAYSMPSYSAEPGEERYTDNEEVIARGAQAVVDNAYEIIKDCGVEVSSIIKAGDPIEILREISKSVGLIVIGSRGTGSFADRLLGSTSASLPAHSYCPVIVVPRNINNRDFLPVKRIVVGVDGSNAGSISLVEAVNEAKIWNAELTAVEAVPMGGSAGMLAWLPVAVDREAVLNEVRQELEASCKELSEKYEYPIQACVMDNSPVSVLTEFSTAVEMVVVGTKGRGGFAGMIMGSTSQSVLAYAYCPILVIPDKYKVAQEQAE